MAAASESPASSLEVAHCQDKAASLRVSCIPCETLATPCIHQSCVAKLVPSKETVTGEALALTNSNQGRMGQGRTMETPESLKYERGPGSPVRSWMPPGELCVSQRRVPAAPAHTEVSLTGQWGGGVNGQVPCKSGWE